MSTIPIGTYDTVKCLACKGTGRKIVMVGLCPTQIPGSFCEQCQGYGTLEIVVSSTGTGSKST